jgi:hypothetical protein
MDTNLIVINMLRESLSSLKERRNMLLERLSQLNESYKTTDEELLLVQEALNLKPRVIWDGEVPIKVIEWSKVSYTLECLNPDKWPRRGHVHKNAHDGRTWMMEQTYHAKVPQGGGHMQDGVFVHPRLIKGIKTKKEAFRLAVQWIINGE